MLATVMFVGAKAVQCPATGFSTVSGNHLSLCDEDWKAKKGIICGRVKIRLKARLCDKQSIQE